jgi:hypothetical protein
MGIIQILLSAVPSGAGITADFLVIAGGGGVAVLTGFLGSNGGGVLVDIELVTGTSSGGNSSAESPLTVDVGTAYTVTVGAGGPGKHRLHWLQQQTDLILYFSTLLLQAVAVVQ